MAFHIASLALEISLMRRSGSFCANSFLTWALRRLGTVGSSSTRWAGVLASRSNTYQVKDYSRYEFAPDTAEAKQAYRDTHWEDDLAAACAAGRRMAEKIVS